MLVGFPNLLWRIEAVVDPEHKPIEQWPQDRTDDYAAGSYGQRLPRDERPLKKPVDRQQSHDSHRCPAKVPQDEVGDILRFQGRLDVLAESCPVCRSLRCWLFRHEHPPLMLPPAGRGDRGRVPGCGWPSLTAPGGILP